VEDAAVMPPVAVTSSAEVRLSLPLILTDVIAAPSNAAMAVGGEITVLAETAPADPAIIVLGRPTLEQPRTLAEVLLRLGQLPMSPRRRADMQSGVRTVCRALGRAPSDMPTDPTQLRELMAGASPASVGLMPDRWNRARSLTLGALRDLGMRTMPGRGAGRLSLAWGALLTHLPNEHSHIGLTRFMGYCSREGIAPNDVDPKTFINFRDALLTTSLLAKPEAVFRTTVRLWNRFASSVAGWPREIIPLATSERV
jgi:hypothetical protein